MYAIFDISVYIITWFLHSCSILVKHKSLDDKSLSAQLRHVIYIPLSYICLEWWSEIKQKAKLAVDSSEN